MIELQERKLILINISKVLILICILKDDVNNVSYLFTEPHKNVWIQEVILVDITGSIFTVSLAFVTCSIQYYSMRYTRKIYRSCIGQMKKIEITEPARTSTESDS